MLELPPIFNIYNTYDRGGGLLSLCVCGGGEGGGGIIKFTKVNVS